MRRRDEALHAVAGSRVDPIACLRPPYAATNERAIRVAGELGKAIVLWSIDPQDRRRPGADQIASHILANVYPGAIILMHDGGDERAQTVAALEIVLDGASPRARVKPPNPPTPRQQARWKAIRQAQLQGLSMRATARVLGHRPQHRQRLHPRRRPTRAPGCGIMYEQRSNARGNFR